MWQRFTERARRIVFFAQQEASSQGENYVSTEHLLLGLIRESDCVGATILEKLGVTLEKLREEVEAQLVKGDGRGEADMQLTPRAKRIIDLAYDEARTLENNYIGTEHILLGLVREGEGLAGQTLAKAGIDLERVRAEVRRLQAENPKTDAPIRSAKWQIQPGNLGILKSEDGGESAIALTVGEGLWERFFTTWNARDPYGWKELVDEGAVISLPAGTRAKFLKLVSGNLALVRVLEGEREGEALYIPWESFRLTGADTAPWPPNSPVIGGRG